MMIVFLFLGSATGSSSSQNKSGNAPSSTAAPRAMARNARNPMDLDLSLEQGAGGSVEPTAPSSGLNHASGFHIPGGSRRLLNISPNDSDAGFDGGELGKLMRQILPIKHQNLHRSSLVSRFQNTRSMVSCKLFSFFWSCRRTRV